MKIICLHGNAQTPQIFNRLEKHCNFETLTLAGHGQAPHLKQYSLDNHVDYNNHKLSDEDYLLIGHSLGGHIALRMALKNPRIKGLIITGAPIISPDTMPLAFLPETNS